MVVIENELECYRGIVYGVVVKCFIVSFDVV